MIFQVIFSPEEQAETDARGTLVECQRRVVTGVHAQLGLLTNEHHQVDGERA